MLVLSRKVGEKIVIADNITLTVIRIDSKQVRLGIEAPSTVGVYREELLLNPPPVIRPDIREGLKRHTG